jgi:heme/copper-type cytochrome/quinol oxidase subunit 1
MRRVRPWGLAQRIILVIALALALSVLGRYLVSLGHRSDFGWFAYAPVSSIVPAPSVGPRPWVRVLIWLGLIVVWAAVSAWLLRPTANQRRQGRGPLPDER